MDQIHRTIQKAINCRMAFFMKQLIENPNLDYEVDEKGTLKISV